MCLAVPPPGILRTSSSHSSSSNQPEPEPERPKPETEPERARPAPPTYSARSDTVLEICLESDDISFIDDDLEGAEEQRSSETGHVGSDDDSDSDDSDEDDGGEGDGGDGGDGGEIVIKLNNSNSPLLTCRAVQPVQPQPDQADNYDELSETSFQLGYDVSVRAPMSYEETSSQSSVETVDTRVGVGRGRGRRNLLVRQSRLETDLHPEQARKRHSLATSSQQANNSQESSDRNKHKHRGGEGGNMC